MKKPNRGQHILQQVRANMAEKPVAEQNALREERYRQLFADAPIKGCCAQMEVPGMGTRGRAGK